MEFLRRIRNRYLCIIDFFLCVLAFAAAVRLIIPGNLFLEYFTSNGSLIVIGATAVIYCTVLMLFGIYATDWVHAGANDYLRLIFSTCVSSAFCSVVCLIIFRDALIYPKMIVTANLFAVALVCTLRFFVRLLYKLHLQRNTHNGKRVLIIGAGNLAVALLRDIEGNEKLNYDVVGLIDDDPAKLKSHIYGASVIGNRNDIVRICKERQVAEIIFAIYKISNKARVELLDICSKAGCNVKILPGFETFLNAGTSYVNLLREINIEDLLEREPIMLDNNIIGSTLSGKTILVTGGGGSIGSELCRQIITHKPKKLIILDIYENTAYDLQNELNDKHPDMDVMVLIASVRDKKRLDEIFDEYHPDIVFHAAAHKHVPLMEYSPKEAIKNNVFGTYNTALTAAEHNCEKFVMISTDKAVNPTNVMGATKRMCEMIVQTLQQAGKTEFVAVRFGNVLGSNGSVIPLFRKQIAAGGPVTVTHPEITRFFMTIPEAAQLVLQAASYAKGGEIFILDMGSPVKIYDLACKMISLSGYKPNVDVEIKITGLRPGEKLYEELLMNEEGLQKTAHSKIFVGRPIDISMTELKTKLETLDLAIKTPNTDIRQVLCEVVPTYVPNAEENT